jgi:hypothetical protein
MGSRSEPKADRATVGPPFWRGSDIGPMNFVERKARSLVTASAIACLLALVGCGGASRTDSQPHAGVAQDARISPSPSRAVPITRDPRPDKTRKDSDRKGKVRQRPSRTSKKDSSSPVGRSVAGGEPDAVIGRLKRSVGVGQEQAKVLTTREQIRQAVDQLAEGSRRDGPPVDPQALVEKIISGQG